MATGPWFLKLSGTPTTVHKYEALIKNLKIKRDNNLKKIIKHKPHIFGNTQHCWQLYITIPAVHFKLCYSSTQNGDALKLLNLI